MLQKKPVLWISMIGLLALMNLLRWAPQLWKGKNEAGSGTTGWMHLNFSQPLAAEDQKVRRNLFVLGASGTIPRPKRMVKAAPVPTPLANPTPSFPDGSVMEAAGGYRLMGVVSRGGASQALIGRGSQLFQVGQGDSLDDRYQAQSIGENEVTLTEKATGSAVKLRIWDPSAAGIPGPQANNGGMTQHDHD